MTLVHWVHFVSMLLFPWALTIGGFSAVLGWRPGAWIMVGAVCERIASNVLAAVAAYREVMSRPWPAVPPLTDDDDDWW
jgi:hypothetical protein